MQHPLSFDLMVLGHVYAWYESTLQGIVGIKKFHRRYPLYLQYKNYILTITYFKLLNNEL